MSLDSDSKTFQSIFWINLAWNSLVFLICIVSISRLSYIYIRLDQCSHYSNVFNGDICFREIYRRRVPYRVRWTEDIDIHLLGTKRGANGSWRPETSQCHIRSVAAKLSSVDTAALNTAATLRVEYNGSNARRIERLHWALNAAAPLPVEYSGYTARWIQRFHWTVNTATTLSVEFSGSTARRLQRLHCVLSTAAPLSVEYRGYNARWIQRLNLALTAGATLRVEYSGSTARRIQRLHCPLISAAPLRVDSSDQFGRLVRMKETSPTWQTAGSISTLLWGYERCAGYNTLNSLLHRGYWCLIAIIKNALTIIYSPRSELSEGNGSIHLGSNSVWENPRSAHFCNWQWCNDEPHGCHINWCLLCALEYNLNPILCKITLRTICNFYKCPILRLR